MTKAAQPRKPDRLAERLKAAASLLAIALVALPAGGCFRSSPRFQAPFTLANPTERHPVLVRQGEVTLDLAVVRGTGGLTPTQRAKLRIFLADYHRQKAERLLIKAPSGVNESATLRAVDDVRAALRDAGISSRNVLLEPYYVNGDPAAPLRLSYLRMVAQGPDCPDWSENVARDPQNMPSPNMGCATQRNFAAAIDNPNDLIEPRDETPRPGERRDVVWGKYVKGEPTVSKWSKREHVNASEISPTGGD